MYTVQYSLYLSEINLRNGCYIPTTVEDQQQEILCSNSHTFTTILWRFSISNDTFSIIIFVTVKRNCSSLLLFYNCYNVSVIFCFLNPLCNLSSKNIFYITAFSFCILSFINVVISFSYTIL
jgi:hypothetical protein